VNYVQQKLKVLKIQHLIVSYFGWKMGLATTLGFASLRLTPFPTARRSGTDIKSNMGFERRSRREDTIEKQYDFILATH
jgi:hypothetical protein